MLNNMLAAKAFKKTIRQMKYERYFHSKIQAMKPFHKQSTLNGIL